MDFMEFHVKVLIAMVLDLTQLEFVLQMELVFLLIHVHVKQVIMGQIVKHLNVEMYYLIQQVYVLQMVLV